MFAFLNKRNKNSCRTKEYSENYGILDSLSNVGLVRNNNEDRVTTIVHPKNSNLKLLAVADGVGGYENGEIASNFTITTLQKWFTNLSEDLINNSKYISKSVTQIIKFINN